MITTKICQGISDISDSYSGFIVDQWGVLHDGDKPYEGVVECLKELKGRGKYIIILSNSGKTADSNRERLKQIGIPSTLYNDIVTSGEMTWQGLKAQGEGIFKDLGQTCYLISRGGDQSILEGVDIKVADDPDDADFLIISGSDAPDKTIEDYEPALRKAARKRLKALCANPDSKAIIGETYVMGAGSIARRYQDFGGVVHYIGKPHLPIFQYCMKILQEKGIYPGETVMIGDTMSHDILGGFGANIDTCLVKNGLHAGVFRGVKDLTEFKKALATLCAQYNNVQPTFMVDRFKWGKALPDRKHKKRAGSKR